MEDYVGKLCPFCRTEIKAGEAVKACPSCGLAHHQACWDENGGCSTFGCSERHDEPAATAVVTACASCGAPLGAGQAFCPQCGAKIAEPKELVCSGCGAQLHEGQAFCDRCGRKCDPTVDGAVSSAIDRFNSGIEKKRKRSRLVPIVIAVFCILAIGAGYFVIKTAQEKKAAEERAAAISVYINDVKAFAAMALTAGSNLEDIADTCQEYWYDAIWNDDYYGDIDLAILTAMVDKSDALTTAEEHYAKLQTLYGGVKKTPEGIGDKDLEDICDAVKDLYNSYTDYYDFAVNPSGNYTSFSESNTAKTDAFIFSYRALDNLLS